MRARLRPYDPGDRPACEAILAALPEWFGMPESNVGFVRDLESHPSWVAELDERVIGVLTLASCGPRSQEITFLAVHPDHHRSGLGRRLVAAAESAARAAGTRWLHVKTLGPTHPDPHYARTRAFYVEVGFEPLFETIAMWGPANPALVSVKRL